VSQCKATIYVQNNTDSRVLVQLYHKNVSDGVQSAGMIIEAGKTSNTTLTVDFQTGPLYAMVPDDWFCVLHVVSGSSKGTYVSGDGAISSIDSPSWKECQLQSSDNGKAMTFSVSTTRFDINVTSGPTATKMRRFRDFKEIQHVFMLMLENHSFDNMLAFSGIAGIQHATTSSSNSYESGTYHVSSPAQPAMDKGPGHEFADVLEQVCGQGAVYQAGKPYPPVNNSGFAVSYGAISPAQATNLDFTVKGNSSPSIASTLDGSFRLAMQTDGWSGHAEGRLCVDGPGYIAQPAWGLAANTSPSIAMLGSSWRVAFNANSTNVLWVADPSGGNTGVQMAAHSSPSLAATPIGDGWGWRAAIQSTRGSSKNELTVVYSEGRSSDHLSGWGLDPGTSPSIIVVTTIVNGQPTSDWRVAFSAAGSCKLWVVSKGVPGDTDIPMKPGSSPSLTAMPGGSWLAAIQDADGQACVVRADKTKVGLGFKMRAGTNPSIAATPSGVWFVAFQNELGTLCVVSGQDAQTVFIGASMKDATSPSITVTSDGGWRVAYVDATGKPAIVDEHGNGPQPSSAGNIMACFDTKTQLPVMQTLAQDFNLCDHWYSSLPGPTWPNRFFAHCGSSGGMDDSPDQSDIIASVSVDGYAMPSGSIYDKLKQGSWAGSSNRLSYRFYQDSQTGLATVWAVETMFGKTAALALSKDSMYSDNPSAGGGNVGCGWVPQVLALKGIGYSEFASMSAYGDDLLAPYDAAYTVIEPHYGNVWNDTYRGGSSQHPTDDTCGGEGLIKAVYEKLRASPLWYTSLLIITYDEHGGFYDSVVPPAATPPGDGGTEGNKHGFDFSQYGVRVPAIIISPTIAEGVSHTAYDHASIPKTLEACFGLPSLTQRDATANQVLDLCTLSIAAGNIRTDCVSTLPDPVRKVGAAAPAPAGAPPGAAEAGMDEPLPQRGNIIGVLHILLKIELSLREQSPESRAAAIEAFKSIKTRGDAAGYAEKVLRMMQAQRS